VITLLDIRSLAYAINLSFSSSLSFGTAAGDTVSDVFFSFSFHERATCISHLTLLLFHLCFLNHSQRCSIENLFNILFHHGAIGNKPPLLGITLLVLAVRLLLLHQQAAEGGARWDARLRCAHKPAKEQEQPLHFYLFFFI
jgi:hypothetical protein